MAFGVIAHDRSQMHWFSDLVAGGLMGYAIGSTVGSNFREAFEKSGNRKEEAIWNITPVITSKYKGVLFSMNF